MSQVLAWLSSLRLAIVLILLIAAASGLGTALPQGEPSAFYAIYNSKPWLGVLDAGWIRRLQLDHVYSSAWFLTLLGWLGLALILCSWRRQWPALRKALTWHDYEHPRQLSKLALSESLTCTHPQEVVSHLGEELRQRGWMVRLRSGRLAARRGLAGRVGPLVVHTGLVVLMVGAAWGALAGQQLERFLTPGRAIELLDPRGNPQLTLELDSFAIDRDPAGRPEQFRSLLRLWPELGEEDLATSKAADKALSREISVNHPLRYRGMTLYQADWSLAAITLRLDNNPPLQLPLQPLDQLGDQIWGLVLPTRPDGGESVLLVLTSEQGPVQVFDSDGSPLAWLKVGTPAERIKSVPLQVMSVLPASGLLFKRDPGVPIVYGGFTLVLGGGSLSVLATRQVWAIADSVNGRLYLGGLCNRNLTGLADELPQLASAALNRAGAFRDSLE